MRTGVIIARFQTPYLHDGHLDLVEKVRTDHHKLVVILGISPIVGSRTNPYDYHTREKLIKSIYHDIIVLPLSDHPNDDQWSTNLDLLLTGTLPTEEFTLYGSRDSFIPYYTGKYETTSLPEHGDYNATELRKKYSTKVFDSKDFRAGILYAYHNQYTKVYPTVDIAVFRNNRQEILLGKKTIDNRWRLIGGFSDPEDDSYETSAKRELIEECGPLEVSEMTYETSKRVDDWRYRKEKDKIITLLYSCDLIYGSPKAHDDICDLQWFDISTLDNTRDITPEHQELLKFINKKYLNV